MLDWGRMCERRGMEVAYRSYCPQGLVPSWQKDTAHPTLSGSSTPPDIRNPKKGASTHWALIKGKLGKAIFHLSFVTILGGRIHYPIAQLEARLGEGKILAQGHIAGKWGSWASNPGPSGSETPGSSTGCAVSEWSLCTEALNPGGAWRGCLVHSWP